jgi:S-DNA-T family DNA segregation ATPase FtsK/SpoIIIE
LLQTYFTLGYARAARMMDGLEAEGVISEANGAKPREVLMKYNEGENNNG